MTRKAATHRNSHNNNHNKIRNSSTSTSAEVGGRPLPPPPPSQPPASNHHQDDNDDDHHNARCNNMTTTTKTKRKPWTNLNPDCSCLPDNANLVQRWFYSLSLHNGAFVMDRCERWSLFAVFWVCAILMGMHLYSFTSGFWNGFWEGVEKHQQLQQQQAHLYSAPSAYSNSQYHPEETTVASILLSSVMEVATSSDL